MEKDTTLKTTDAASETAVPMPDAPQTTSHASSYTTEHGSGRDKCDASSFRDLEAALPADTSSITQTGDGGDKVPAQHTLSLKIHPEDSADSSLRGTAHGDDKHHSVIDIEPAKESQFKSTDHMKKDKLPVGESKSSIDNTENLSEPVGLRRRRSSRVEFQKPSTQDGGRQTPEDEKSKDLPVSGAAHKSAERKGSKQVKAKGIVEKESSSVAGAKVVGKKGVESPSLEDSRDMEPPDRKVHESLDTFIRQTMGQTMGAREQWDKPYMSHPRHGDKPNQRMIEHQQAARSLKSLRVDVEGQDDSTNVDHLQVDLERDSLLTGTKGVGSLGKGLHGDRHLHALKSSIPQASLAFAKNSDLPGWPLLSPSKVQLQKCDKCLREFCSLLNLRRHIRTHRRISHADKEDLDLKRTEVAAFWDKLNDEEAQQILSSSKSIDLEDQSGEMVVNRLIEFLSQGSPTPLPPAYLKAGQDLLELMDNRQGVVSLHSSRLLSILDEASERTFLSNELKGDASKDVLDDKNLVASLSIIFEQSLVKAWMADKESEALRNQQELVKEEEAAQMKRERTVAKKKKKKEKSRQKGLKDRKLGASTTVLNEENESVDEENPSPEIVEEDNSPTASSTSLNSSAHDNPLLLESQEPEVIDQGQAEGRDRAISGEGDQPPKPKDTSSVQFLTKDHASDTAHGNRGKQIHSDLGSTDREREQPLVISSPAQSKLDDDKTEQEHNALDFRKYEPGRQAKEVPRVDYQERGGVSDPRYQEGPQQSSYRTVRRPSSGISYSSRSERGSSPVPGFYRGKPTVNRGAMPFQATQQWAKKTHPPALVDNTKEGEEDGDGERDNTSTIKTRVKESSLELPLAREMDADPGLSTSRTAKEEIRSIDRKEPLPLPMTSAAKVVASTGGMGNLSNLPFSLDGNPEDWPPLSGSKNAGPSTLATIHSDVDARALQKASTEKPGGHLGLEAKVEGSHVRVPSAARSVVKSGGEAETANSLMVGQLPVPLDYGNMTRPGSGIGSNKSSSFLSSQSYTAAVGVPQVRPTRDFNPSSGSGQRLNEAAINPEFEDSSGMQAGDGSAVSNQYRSSSFRPTVSSPLLKNMRGPVYPTIERAPLTRQPSWSSNTVRYPPQKVWRPVRPTGENVDPVLGGGTGTDGSSTGFYERDTVETAGSEEGATDLNAVGNLHVGDDKNRFAKAESSSQCKTSEDVAPASSNVDYTRDSSSNYMFGVVEPGKSQYDLHGGSKFAEDNRVECSIGAPISRVNTEQANLHARDTSAGEPDMENLQEKVNRKSEEEFDKESTPAPWTAKVVELHKQRWKDANLNPDTVTHKDNQERPELQTTVWDEFLASMEEGIAVLQLADLGIASDGLGRIGGQSPSNKVDDQEMDIQGCGQKSSGDLPAHVPDKGTLPATTLMECERQVSRGDT